MARRGAAWRGTALHGRAWPGKAGNIYIRRVHQGAARRGKAGQGGARQGILMKTDMSNPADLSVIKATFYDWRPIKGRKQLQLIFEVPLEQTNEVLRMLGAPMPDKETWVAIALLDMAPDLYPNGKFKTERKAFCDLPYSQQAGIKSDDPKFIDFLVAPEMASEGAAEAIRKYCGVDSRSKIIKGTRAGNLWLQLMREYERSK
jgi:hypothetical protein